MILHTLCQDFISKHEFFISSIPFLILFVLTCFALTLDEPTRSREIRKSTVHILKAKTGVCHVVMVIHIHTHAVTHIQSHALTTTKTYPQTHMLIIHSHTHMSMSNVYLLFRVVLKKITHPATIWYRLMCFTYRFIFISQTDLKAEKIGALM